MDDQTFDIQTAQDWIKAVESTERSFRDDYIYPKIDDLIHQNLPTRILDVGCGQGVCSGKINLKYSAYTGVEPSIFLLDRAKQLYPQPNKDFLLGNAYALPLSEGSFEVVFSVMVWHLLGDLQKAASELSRVLIENGNFLIVTANPDAYSIWKAFYPDAKLTGKKLEGTMQLGETLSSDVLYLHTFDEIKDSFEKVGLTIRKTETFLPTKNSGGAELLISIQGKKSAKF
jgi:SAM-dependent methyltransferase